MPSPSTRLRLRVVPGASSDAVVGRHAGARKVRVAAPAEHGAANRALVRLLSDALAVPRRAVTVVSGHGARDKIVQLTGIAASDVEDGLSAAERKDRR